MEPPRFDWHGAGIDMVPGRSPSFEGWRPSTRLPGKVRFAPAAHQKGDCNDDSSKGLGFGLGGTLLLAAAFSALTGMASADPANARNALPIMINCNNGQTYGAVTNGGGNTSRQVFAPAHDLNSTAVLIPISFGEATFSEHINGVLVDQETQPPARKGNARVPANTMGVSCDYSFSQTQTDPNTGDVFRFSGSGTVDGFIPGAHS